ncbi:MAG: PepSY domain-containing protein [Lawsonibacter sp.]|nr:PepSY domain-containing protein [Lawsonibacter sp.]
MRHNRTGRELERRLADAVSRSAPQQLEELLSRCSPQQTEQHRKVVPMTEKKSKRVWAGLTAACLALILAGGGGGLYFYQTRAVASVISLDVNPSIEVTVNRSQQVLSCTPLNPEAAQVLFSMDGGNDLKGAKIEVAVNAIVGALVSNGYLDRISSAILISVEDQDQNRAARLEESLAGTVDALLQNQAPNAAVLSQTLTADAGLNRQAQQNSISAGKAALVNRVLALNSTLSFDQLATLTVDELRDLIETGAPAMPIGISTARTAAETHAGTLTLDSVTADVDPELDDKPPHYEVELHTAWGEFEYKIDAYTGAVLSGPANILPSAGSDPGQTVEPSDITSGDGAALGSGKVEYTPSPAPDTADPAPSTQTPAAPSLPDPAPLTNQEAQEIALSHAGLSAAQVTGLKSEQDWDDGQLEYEIEFWFGSVEYEYTILAADGTILDHEMDNHGIAGSGVGTDYIGETAAKNAALSHVGLSERDTTSLRCWMDYDDGRPECYKVEFWAGDTEYEYEIGLNDGCILKCEHETHHNTSHHN